MQELTELWCDKQGLLRSPTVVSKFRALGYGRLMSTLCPRVSLERLMLVADWNSYFFIVDDQQNNAVTTNRVGRYAEIIASMREIIVDDCRSTPLHGHPLIESLRDLLQRTFPGQRPDWAARFRRNLNLWLSGHLAENGYRVSGTIPQVADYISLRRDASTVLPTLDLVEITEGASVLESLY
ncbi:terpene synthase family protein, partial [Nocardia brasiliensis]|uniref:terpene synthase family protein n=1 Tax=Nocardia brasiliensis TaxID=37326 RepID=UPI0011DD0EA8